MAAQSRNIAELENASVWRLLIQYSLPSIAGMVVYSLYNIIDSVFIGHGVGPLALSGLAVTFPIMNLTFALGTLVGIGGAAISSIRLGRKDQEGTERTLGNVLIMSLIAAVVLVIPTLLFLTEILTAFGASGQTLTYAYDFMLITLLGLPVTYVFFNLNHVMRATGYPKSHGLHPSFRRNQHHPGSHLHLLVQMGHYRSSRGHPSRPGRRHGARAVTLFRCG